MFVVDRALASRLNVESVTGQPTHDWCAARWSRIGWRGTQGMDTGAGEPLPPNRRFPNLSLPGLSPGNGQSGNCKSCVYGFGPELMLRIQTEHVCMAIHARIPAQSAHVCTQEHSAATPFSAEIQGGRVHVICPPLLNSPCANCSPFRTQHVRRPTTRHTTHGTRNSGEAITAIGPHARATTLSPLLHPLPSLGKQHHIALDQGPPAHDVDDGKRPTKGTPHPSGSGFRATRSVQCRGRVRPLPLARPVLPIPSTLHPGHTGQQKGGPPGSRAQHAPMSSESKTKTKTTKTQPILLLGNDA